MPTKIEWCRNTDGTMGETWNIITGCEPLSAECDHCYARRMATRLAGRYGYPNDNPFRPGTFHANKLTQPDGWKKPRMIFVSSMGDLFHEAVSFEQFMQVMETILRNPQHTFLFLTKRPKRMSEFLSEFLYIHSSIPANIWFGVTVGFSNPIALDRLNVLMRHEAFQGQTRFVSVEPMIGGLELGALDWLDWVICGAETGPKARLCNPDWVRSLRDQCVAANVPFFFKKFADGCREIDGERWEQMPEVTR